eukprot:6185072-Pleurochrysis_carterae.AAC.3
MGESCQAAGKAISLGERLSAPGRGQQSALTTGEARAETSMRVTQTRGLSVLEALTGSNTAIGVAMCRAASRLSGTGARWPAPPLPLRSYGEAAEQPRHAILEELVYSSHMMLINV